MSDLKSEKTNKGTKKNIAGWIILSLLIIGMVTSGVMLYRTNNEYKIAMNNRYNMAFTELIDYIANVENYLAKSTISKNSEHGAETLTHLWREADLAASYLAMLPIDSNSIQTTSKFLNQVSNYSYTLSRKNIYQEDLTDEELKNLEDLHEYSIELGTTLKQLSSELLTGKIEWGDLSEKGTVAFAQQVDNVSKDSFNSLEENFHEYSGLIYDGAFSEHLTGEEKKGLTGDEISEDEAKKIVEELVGTDNISDMSVIGISDNATIPAYDFSIKNKDNNNINVSISKKGGHIVYMNSNRDVGSETLSYEQANEKGKAFLKEKGYDNMNETYYIKQEGVITINYAYTMEDDITVYSDLIKLKVSLDNGEVLGMETTVYLNNHTERILPQINITMEEAKQDLNKDLEIISEGLAIIPTEWQTELLCYEFKGKIKDTEFLVYVNAENGREEDILVIKETPNGILTM